MNKTPSYKTQFDKITEAYIKGEIQPSLPNFCFCGTLADTDKWNYGSENSPYSVAEYNKMESALLIPFGVIRPNGWYQFYKIQETDNFLYEELIFKGMCDALEVLKQIHQSKGEVIDETPPFVKRNLNPKPLNELV